MRGAQRLILIGGVLVATLVGAGRADAGCGCQKPPPLVAPIRPPFASPGDSVTLIADGLVVGASYRATFHGWNADGATGAEAIVEGVAVSKRDFADGVVKTQLVVTLPDFEPGPAAVTVVAIGDEASVLAVPAADFTVLQPALALQETKGNTIASCYRAAVAMDGTVFLPLDISDVADRMIFSGRAGGYRLTFAADDLVIYNTQGVTMQLLAPGMVGLYTIDDAPEAGDDEDELGPSGRSFRMTYDRHEFLTYRALHETDPNYAHDPNDPDWHVDGTRHYDHDHLVLAIRGFVDNATRPEAGTTPPFNFRVQTTPASPNGHPTVNTTIQWSAECGDTAPIDPRATDVAAPVCGATPFVGCRQPVGSGRSRLQIDDGEKDTHDAIVWKWAYGQDTALGNFGDPREDDGLALCLYDESGEVPALVFGAGVPANEGCDASGDRPCWTVKGAADNPRGFAYQHRGGVPDGIDGVTLKTGRDGRAKIVVAGGGEHLDLPALPIALSLRAQLQSATGQCWESSFAPAGVRENTATRFRARSE